ncbi:hypothetical protein NDU88_004438 [Pleurodeles waltl]|uniref:Uncharacterized protein n=1 Tax=Pleurodeles waltl TaxID=8319 RepID=A0AAV7VH45_PLEWA|nr:hypothetical protein NDU88_004438 [Pleurodeles waltl]
MWRRRLQRHLGEEVGTEGRCGAGAAREAACGQTPPGVYAGGGTTRPIATCVERGHERRFLTGKGGEWRPRGDAGPELCRLGAHDTSLWSEECTR